MTNKVKPFYIKITDNMTPQMVQNAFDKCHKVGIKNGEPNDAIENLHDWNYFGVCREKGTCFYDSYSSFRGDAQEITLDQLDEWLGLESKAEWNSEGLPPVGVECEIELPQLCEVIKIKVVSHIKDECSDDIVFYEIKDKVEGEFKYGWCYASSARFIKPETPEQRAERERLEAAYDLYSDWRLHCEYAKFSFADFCETVDDKNFWLSTVDKTNYRKQ